MLWRTGPRYPGLYIDGSIGGVEVAFTVDTGATHTILSSRVYERIPITARPKLIPGGPCPSAADGRRLDHRGSAIFELCLGNLCLRKKVDVADIADDVLLGADVLVYGPHGPADLVLSEGLVQLRGVSIPLRQVNSAPRTLRVRAADHYVVPSMAEMVLDAYVEAPSPQILRTCSQLVVEPAPTLVRDYRLAMAPTLVDATSNCTVKVRVMNSTHDPVSVKQDALLGHAGDIVGVEDTVLQQEDSGEADNYSCIRRSATKAPHQDEAGNPEDEPMACTHHSHSQRQRDDLQQGDSQVQWDEPQEGDSQMHGASLSKAMTWPMPLTGSVSTFGVLRGARGNSAGRQGACESAVTGVDTVLLVSPFSVLWESGSVRSRPTDGASVVLHLLRAVSLIRRVATAGGRGHGRRRFLRQGKLEFRRYRLSAGNWR